MAKLNYQKAKDRDRARKALAAEARDFMMTPPPALRGKTVHLKITCRRCNHRADMLLSAERIARHPMLRCTQCGAGRRL